MTQEDKELLLKDLCARLPYGINFKANNEECIRKIHYIKDEDVYVREYRHLSYWIEEIKPYLRPMSSMTDEERKDFYENLRPKYDGKPWESMGADVDWLNAHHFDYRGLIPKGLALIALEGMYNLNKK